MIELRFCREIYRGRSVDEAIKVFAPHADMVRSEGPEHWVVQVSAATPERERRVAGELGNYALGLTVKSGGAPGKEDGPG